MSDKKTVLFKIKRQPNPNVRPYWEEFELPWHSGMNVISSLMEIADYLRLQLPRRSLRILRHADQRTRPHGLLRPGG
jgi:hypothetical protein